METIHVHNGNHIIMQLRSSMTGPTTKLNKSHLTIETLALRSSRFSSCNDLHLDLNESSSIFSTRFSCCRDSILFCKCSMCAGDGGLSVGPPPSMELVSLSSSLALSAIVPLVFDCWTQFIIKKHTSVCAKIELEQTNCILTTDVFMQNVLSAQTGARRTTYNCDNLVCQQ